MTQSSKENKAELVANVILRILDMQCMNSITHSRVAQLAKVSRSWLYKYIGNKKSDLVDYAISNFGKQFTNLEKPYRGTNPASFRKAVMIGNIEMFEKSLKMPHLISYN